MPEVCTPEPTGSGRVVVVVVGGAGRVVVVVVGGAVVVGDTAVVVVVGASWRTGDASSATGPPGGIPSAGGAGPVVPGHGTADPAGVGCRPRRGRGGRLVPEQQERRQEHGSAEEQRDSMPAAPMAFGPQDSTLLVGRLPSPDSPGGRPTTDGRARPRGEDGHGTAPPSRPPARRSGTGPGCRATAPTSGRSSRLGHVTGGDQTRPPDRPCGSLPRDPVPVRIVRHPGTTAHAGPDSTMSRCIDPGTWASPPRSLRSHSRPSPAVRPARRPPRRRWPSLRRRPRRPLLPRRIPPCSRPPGASTDSPCR